MGADTGIEHHGCPTTSVIRKSVLNVKENSGCGMLGGEDGEDSEEGSEVVLGGEVVMGEEGGSHASSTTNLRQIAPSSQINSQPETDAATEASTPPVINAEPECIVNDGESRGGTLEAELASRTSDVAIQGAETTHIAPILRQGTGDQAEIGVRGPTTVEYIAQEPGRVEQAAAQAEPVLQGNVIVHDPSSSAFSSSSRAL